MGASTRACGQIHCISLMILGVPYNYIILRVAELQDYTCLASCGADCPACPDQK